MEKLKGELEKLIDDEGLIEYLVEAAKYSSAYDDFKSVASQIFLDYEVAQSDDEADKLSEKMYSIYSNNENNLSTDSPIKRPIEMNKLLDQTSETDPFDLEGEPDIFQIQSKDNDNDFSTILDPGKTINKNDQRFLYRLHEKMALLNLVNVDECV